MHSHALLTLLYLTTPLHAGSGESSPVVDLPIQRERTTGYPMIQSSGVKGSLRRAFAERGLLDDQDAAAGTSRLSRLFGPDDASDVGAIAVTDARVLFFPVRSARGVFAWITCPHVLGRLATDLTAGGGADTALQVSVRSLAECDLPSSISPEPAIWSTRSPNTLGSFLYLEERAFATPSADPAFGNTRLESLRSALGAVAQAIAGQAGHDPWRGRLSDRAVVVPDDAFRDFVTFSTEIETHVKIDERTGRVADTGPWDVEYLPSQTVMYLVTSFQASRPNERSANGSKEVITAEANQRLFLQGIRPGTKDTGERSPGLPFFQIGGDETLGRGLVAASFPPIAGLGQTRPGGAT